MGEGFSAKIRSTKVAIPGLPFSWHPDDQGRRHNW